MFVQLLSDYDKGNEPSIRRQNAETKRAKQRLARWKSRQGRTGKQHKLTQKQLAAVSEINQGEISRIERGQTNPTATTLAALLASAAGR